MFSPSSRYADARLRTLTIDLPDGQTVAYKEARVLPASDPSTASGEIAAAIGERLDALTARALGNSELFWRMCDVNEVMDPLAEEAVWPKIWRLPPPEDKP